MITSQCFPLPQVTEVQFGRRISGARHISIIRGAIKNAVKVSQIASRAECSPGKGTIQ